MDKFILVKKSSEINSFTDITGNLIIGRNYSIRKRCILHNCIILDNVIIDDEVIISNSVIGAYTGFREPPWNKCGTSV